MPSKKDAAWWRDYRVRRRHAKGEGGPHEACDKRERALLDRIAALEAEIARLRGEEITF